MLELALREALSFGKNDIDSEHILIALAREDDGIAHDVLNDLHADVETIRGEVIRILSGSGGRRAARLDGPWKTRVQTTDEVLADLARSSGALSDEQLDDMIRALTERQRAASNEARALRETLVTLTTERANRRGRDEPGS